MHPYYTMAAFGYFCSKSISFNNLDTSWLSALHLIWVPLNCELKTHFDKNKIQGSFELKLCTRTLSVFYKASQEYFHILQQNSKPWHPIQLCVKYGQILGVSGLHKGKPSTMSPIFLWDCINGSFLTRVVQTQQFCQEPIKCWSLFYW